MARTLRLGGLSTPLQLHQGLDALVRLVFRQDAAAMDVSAYTFSAAVWDQLPEDSQSEAAELFALTVSFETDGSDGVVLVASDADDRDDGALIDLGTWSARQVEAATGKWRLVGVLDGASPLVIQGDVMMRRFGEP